MLEDVKQLQFLAESNFQVAIVLSEYVPGDERFLSVDDLERYRAISSETRRRELAAGRRAALEAASLLSGQALEGLHIYSENKVPRCSDSSINVSLTHKHGKVVAAASSRPIGIDLEIKKKIQYPAIRARICGPAESEIIKNLPIDEELSFFLIFSIKEAAFKVYSSQGFGVEVLSEIEVERISFEQGGCHFSTSFAARTLEGRSVVADSWVVSLAGMI